MSLLRYTPIFVLSQGTLLSSSSYTFDTCHNQVFRAISSQCACGILRLLEEPGKQLKTHTQTKKRQTGVHPVKKTNYWSKTKGYVVVASTLGLNSCLAKRLQVRGTWTETTSAATRSQFCYENSSHTQNGRQLIRHTPTHPWMHWITDRLPNEHLFWLSGVSPCDPEHSECVPVGENPPSGSGIRIPVTSLRNQGPSDLGRSGYRLYHWLPRPCSWFAWILLGCTGYITDPPKDHRPTVTHQWNLHWITTPGVIRILHCAALDGLGHLFALQLSQLLQIRLLQLLGARPGRSVGARRSGGSACLDPQHQRKLQNTL